MRQPKIFRGHDRTWRHSSVVALMDAHPSAGDPIELLRSLARARVEEARQQGWRGPPFDPELLAGLLDIKVRRGQDGLAHEALIRTCEDGQLEILWNLATSPARRNFSIFHEIAHTLFPDCYEIIRYRSKARRKFDPDRELESLCDIGAAEMLMPLPEFADDVAKLGFSADAVEKLRERYDASWEAVTIRMVQLSAAPCAAAVLSLRMKPTEERQASQTLMSFVDAPKPRLRVDFMVTSASFGAGRLPRHKSVPDTSCVYELAEEPGGRVVSSVEIWGEGRLALPRCRIEALGIPSGPDGQPRVLALMAPVWVGTRKRRRPG